MRRERLRSICDNVFGFAMTLLVLGVAFPVLAKPDLDARLRDELIALLPKIGIFAIGFAILSNWWRTHDKLLDATKHATPPQASLHMLLLLVVALVPFTTATLGNYPREPFAFLLSVANNALVCAVLLALWSHGMRAGTLHGPVGDPTARRIRVRLAVLLGVFVGIAALSFLSDELAFGAFILLAVLWVLPFGFGRRIWEDKFEAA